MAYHQLTSLPISNFGKTVPPERFPKSPLSLATKSRTFNAPCPIQCRVSSVVSCQSQTILRRSAKYQPSIWHHDYIQSFNSQYKGKSYSKQSTVLKEQVRRMLYKEASQVDQLELIDVLQRLGVAYHFDNEVRNIFENVYNDIDELEREKNLYATALAFKLLRQHGYNLAADVFESFQDKMGNFDRSLLVDVKGLLALYEASFHSVEGETILDEARDFSSKFLKEFLNKKSDNNEISALITHALELPLHWRMQRWESLWFIDVYERRHNFSHALLQLAKLDFNMVQSFHQEELKNASKWWKSTGLADKMRFFRDRLMESFIWGLGMDFRPHLGNLRKVTAKSIALLAIIDDTYDVYGTLQELELFTKAINRWDLNCMDNLPDYMKISFHALNNFVNELAFDSSKENGHLIITYLRKAWIDLCNAYLAEAKWYHSGYTPKLQEYMENGWISIGIPAILMHAYFSMPNSLKEEDLICLEEDPNVFRISAIITRLADDLGTCKREMVAGDVSKAIQCYMHESGSSEEEAREYLRCMIRSTWKKMNEEALNSPFNRSFTNIIVNFAKAALWFYEFGDAFSIQDPQTESRILSLIVQPVKL